MSVKIFLISRRREDGAAAKGEEAEQATSCDRCSPPSEKWNADNYGNMAD